MIIFVVFSLVRCVPAELLYVRNTLWPALSGSSSEVECGGLYGPPYVGCSNDGHVLHIVATYKALTGTLPGDLGEALPFLENLELSNNAIHGPLPALPESLRHLRLAFNAFNSTLADALPKSLVHLELQSNFFHGRLPPFPRDLAFVNVARNAWCCEVFLTVAASDFSPNGSLSTCTLVDAESADEHSCFACDGAQPWYTTMLPSVCKQIGTRFDPCNRTASCAAKTGQPSPAPSARPTRSPTPSPTSSPSPSPTAPTASPTPPTLSPTVAPLSPTSAPTLAPFRPTRSPSSSPTPSPTSHDELVTTPAPTPSCGATDATYSVFHYACRCDNHDGSVGGSALYYNASSSSCETCLAGHRCNGLASVACERDTFNDAPGLSRCFSCLPNRCAGANKCVARREGLFCEMCVSGYYNFLGDCRSCENQVVTGIAVFGILLLFIVLAIYIYLKNFDFGPIEVTALKIFIDYAQALSISIAFAWRMRVPLPFVFFSFFNYCFEFLNLLQVAFISTQCTLSNASWYVREVVVPISGMLFVSLALIALTALAYLLYVRSRSNSEQKRVTMTSRKERFFVSFRVSDMVVTSFAMPAVQYLLRPFECLDNGIEWRMRWDDAKCDAWSDPLAWTSFGVAFLFASSLLYFLYFQTRTKKVAEFLTTKDTVVANRSVYLDTWGILYANYSRERPWWETIVYARRFALVFFTILGSVSSHFVLALHFFSSVVVLVFVMWKGPIMLSPVVSFKFFKRSRTFDAGNFSYCFELFVIALIELFVFMSHFFKEENAFTNFLGWTTIILNGAVICVTAVCYVIAKIRQRHAENVNSIADNMKRCVDMNARQRKENAGIKEGVLAKMANEEMTAAEAESPLVAETSALPSDEKRRRRRSGLSSDSAGGVTLSPRSRDGVVQSPRSPRSRATRRRSRRQSMRGVADLSNRIAAAAAAAADSTTTSTLTTTHVLSSPRAIASPRSPRSRSSATAARAQRRRSKRFATLSPRKHERSFNATTGHVETAKAMASITSLVRRLTDSIFSLDLITFEVFREYCRNNPSFTLCGLKKSTVVNRLKQLDSAECIIEWLYKSMGHYDAVELLDAELLKLMLCRDYYIPSMRLQAYVEEGDTDTAKIELKTVKEERARSIREQEERLQKYEDQYRYATTDAETEQHLELFIFITTRVLKQLTKIDAPPPSVREDVKARYNRIVSQCKVLVQESMDEVTNVFMRFIDVDWTSLDAKACDNLNSDVETALKQFSNNVTLHMRRCPESIDDLRTELVVYEKIDKANDMQMYEAEKYERDNMASESKNEDFGSWNLSEMTRLRHRVEAWSESTPQHEMEGDVENAARRIRDGVGEMRRRAESMLSIVMKKRLDAIWIRRRNRQKEIGKHVKEVEAERTDDKEQGDVHGVAQETDARMETTDALDVIATKVISDQVQEVEELVKACTDLIKFVLPRSSVNLERHLEPSQLRSEFARETSRRKSAPDTDDETSKKFDMLIKEWKSKLQELERTSATKKRMLQLRKVRQSLECIDIQSKKLRDHDKALKVVAADSKMKKKASVRDGGAVEKEDTN